MSNGSIWAKDRALSGSINMALVDLGAMTMKGFSASPKAPALLEPTDQIV